MLFLAFSISITPFILNMSNFPLVATLKQGCIVINSDMSYSNHERKPNLNALKQFNTDVYTKTKKLLNKIEDIRVKYEDITDYVNSHKLLHDSHIQLNKEKGIDIKPLGLLSQLQLRKIRKAVENMTSTILFNYNYRLKPWENDNYLSFVTLTLPSKQVHTDAVLRKSLIAFIDNLRKTYGVRYYIWKAEAQQNGNIHFHLLIDKFIDYQQIRLLWNRQIGKLGYIEAYVENRKNEGFIYKEFYYKKGKKIKAKKTYHEQKQVYNIEKLQGFKNPNTTDIKSLENVQETSRYIMKYMDKQEVGKRPILGKIWGLSNDTKKLDYPKITDSEPIFDAVISMISKSGLKLVAYDDFFSVHAGRIHDIAKTKFKDIWQSIKQHYKKLINEFSTALENIDVLKSVSLIKETKKIDPLIFNESNQVCIDFGSSAFWVHNIK
ncbi:rolling circle replication-associated protein [Tenacibaculum adriaticum]|nr:hypothetical protein [Tenacibaculum adriaticum]